MPSVDVSIVIVNWNSKDYVRKCIASVMANTSAVRYEIIVVDSASFDGCGEMLAYHFPQVRFIQSQRNVGFGRANNLGVAHARADVLLLLNPDTEVRGNAIGCLYARFQELRSTGVVGCRLLNSDGTLQTTCVQPFPTIVNLVLNARILQTWCPKSRLWLTAATFESLSTPSPVEVITGACMMIRRDLFKAVGGFGPEFFMYGEDIDLCYRIRAAGFTNYYVRETEIVHHGGGSTQRAHSCFSSVMMCESVMRLLRKTHGRSYSLGYRLAMSGAAIVRLVLLGLYVPVALIGRNALRYPTLPLRKWVSILRWSLGLERWVHDYNPQADWGVTVFARNTEEVDI